jgi:hypothetical protein
MDRQAEIENQKTAALAATVPEHQTALAVITGVANPTLAAGTAKPLRHDVPVAQAQNTVEPLSQGTSNSIFEVVEGDIVLKSNNAKYSGLPFPSHPLPSRQAQHHHRQRESGHAPVIGPTGLVAPTAPRSHFSTQTRGQDTTSGTLGSYTGYAPWLIDTPPAVNGRERMHDDHLRVQSEGESENAGWSNSLTWVSPQAEIKDRFKRVADRAKRMGFNESVAFPKTANELADVQANITEDKIKDIKKRIANQEAEIKARQAATKGPLWNEMIKQKMDELRRPTDGRGVVFPHNSSFNPRPVGKSDEEQGDWPTSADFKRYGDNMAQIGLPRSLPQPRINRPDPSRFPGALRTQWPAGIVPQEARETTDGRWDWVPHKQRERLRKTRQGDEIKFEDLSGPMQNLLKYIWAENSDPESAKGEGSTMKNGSNNSTSFGTTK